MINSLKNINKEYIIQKLDFKSILIVILFIISSIFITKFMLGGQNHRKEIKLLEKENKRLQKQKDSLQIEFVEIQKGLIKDSIELVKLKTQLTFINKKIEIKEIQLKKAIEDLSTFKGSLEKSKKEIDELKNNPVKRTGNELLESIREKTK